MGTLIVFALMYTVSHQSSLELNKPIQINWKSLFPVKFSSSVCLIITSFLTAYISIFELPSFLLSLLPPPLSFFLHIGAPGSIF